MSREEEEENRLKILKSLLFRPRHSIYRVAQLAKLSQPTTLRHVNILTEEGLVTVDQSEEGRRSTRVALTEKGLVYLMLSGKLSDNYLRQAFSEYFTAGDYPAATFKPTLTALRRTLEDVKPRVNLDHYNPGYARGVFAKAFLSHVVEEGRGMVQNGVQAEDLGFSPGSKDVEAYREMLDAWRKQHREEGHALKLLGDSLDRYINHYRLNN